MKYRELTINRPDDWHVHLREGALLEGVLPFTSVQFGRAVVMPNLAEPITTTNLAIKYRQTILETLLPSIENKFTPLMTLYLTDHSDVQDIIKGYKDGVITAVKLYPANSTTNSKTGVSDIKNLEKVFKSLEEIGMPLLIHGEVVDPSVDIFDREKVFIQKVLDPLVQRYPKLKIVLEHITTSDAVDFVRSVKGRVGATITAHHLIISRNALFEGGLQPHHYCLPVAKREEHRLSLREAATSGEPWFFLGTDSAPHEKLAKEAECGCAGIFTAVSALELYASVFDEEKKLSNFEKFASYNGPAFYGLRPNSGKSKLVSKEWRIPDLITLNNGTQIKPFLAGETLNWKLMSN